MRLGFSIEALVGLMGGVSEFGSGAVQKHCRARALALQSWFRRSSLWPFWQLDMSIKKALFWNHSARKRAGKACLSGADNFANTYGTVVPSSIVDSTAWWKRQAKELACICDNFESGLTQTMVIAGGTCG